MSNNLEGKMVNHKKFGIGIISTQKEDSISVIFIDIEKEKTFRYPSCFKSFLTLLDEDSVSSIRQTVVQNREKDKEKKETEQTETSTKEIQVGVKSSGSKSSKIEELRPFPSVKEFCERFRRGLISEIYHLKENGGKHEQLVEGKLIALKNGNHIYTFESDDELSYPPETMITLYKDSDKIPGEIIGCEEFTVILSTEINLGHDVPFIEFTAESWRLIDGLVKRLDEIEAGELSSPIVKSLVCDGFKAMDVEGNEITKGQDQALEMAVSQPITFVWGPPGTGKTETLAKIALEHIRKGNRILMLSYSNVSVDGAIARVYNLDQKKDQKLQPGVIVRYGYPKRKDLLRHPYLTTFNLAIHKHPELVEERKILKNELKNTPRSNPRYVEIKERQIEIRNKLTEEEKECVNRAQFVATTVSKAVVDKMIRESYFDVVIFDEASMAYIPQLVFSAALAQKHFICMGDFRQLPPIVSSNDQSLLNADIFQYCGITEAVDQGRNHKWLCMLDVQYRMHPEISDFVSCTMYNGLLRSDAEMGMKRQDIASEMPFADHAIVFADLSGMMSVCKKTTNESRVNVLSALVSFAFAVKAAQRREVGIITPYNAQSRLLKAMSKDAQIYNPELKLISCATVHQFQGSEKDLIIYDAVDCYRMPFPGILLKSMNNNYANRLFNVALTRAKGKFVSVVNIGYMDKKDLSPKLMYRQMIEQKKNSSSHFKGKELYESIDSRGDYPIKFYTDGEEESVFLKDLSQAKSEIRIDITNRPVNDKLFSKMADVLRKMRGIGIKLFIRAENKKSIPSSLRSLVVENSFVCNPVVLIDKKIVWFGMPHSNSVFIAEGTTMPITYRPVIRMEGAHTAKSLFGLLEMSQTTDRSTEIFIEKEKPEKIEMFSKYVEANTTCPDCNKPMKMKKTRKGKFFLSCTDYPSCSGARDIETNFVDRYLCRNGKIPRCPKCNRVIEAKGGKYGVYVQCDGPSKHKYQCDEI